MRESYHVGNVPTGREGTAFPVGSLSHSPYLALLFFDAIPYSDPLCTVDFAQADNLIPRQFSKGDGRHDRILLRWYKGFNGVPRDSNGSSVDYSIMEYQEHRHSLRGFPVEYAALGFLVEEPLHGYALRSRIAEGLGPLWQVASSQLYQVLHRLEERNHVRPSSDIPSAGPSKTVHHTTCDGEQAFWEWAQAPVSSMRNVRVEFAAKLYFLRRLRPEAVSSLIDSQLVALKELKDRIASTTRKSSDDSTLNSAWHTLQAATIDSFAGWLKDHRESLSTDKENTA